MIMDLKHRAIWLLLILVLWVLVAKVVLAPGRPAVGDFSPAGFKGDPEYVQDVMNDVAEFVVATFQ
jgi:hypothetical protein